MSENESLIQRRLAITPRGLGMATPFTIGSAAGALLQDVEGNEIIDFAAGIGVNSAGHCPEPVVAAIAEQAGKLLHGCIMVATYEPYVALCERLARLFPHGEDTKVLLTNTGSESVENAIKIARQATGRPAVLCYSEAFHGRTMLAMTLTSKISYKRGCGPFSPEVYRLPFPNFYRYGDGLNESVFVARELQRLRDFFHNTAPAREVAAIIIELVQGEGGFNLAPPAYLHGLRRICDEHGILLIFDEVQTGFCRTGKWAAYEHVGVRPDLSTWAKAMGAGLPIGAVMGEAKIMDHTEPGTLGGTYPGNPVACAAALATLDFMEAQDLNARAERLGAIMRERLEALQARCPAIGEVRGLGVMLAIEFVKAGDPNQPDSDLAGELLRACWARRLLVIGAGVYGNVLRFLIPLTMDEATLERGLTIVEEELLKLWRAKSAA